MLLMHIKLEHGFHKANINTIPQITNETICSFISKVAANGKDTGANENVAQSDLNIDYVQVQHICDICTIRGVVFAAPSANENKITQLSVTLKINTKDKEIIETNCEKCVDKESCPHILSFIFWLNRQISDKDVPTIRDYWGSETEAAIEERQNDALRIRDIFECHDLRIMADMEATPVEEADANAFVESILNEMAAKGQTSSALYRQFRPVIDEFETLFIHHIMLDSETYGIKDFHTFLQHLDDQAKQGLFDRLTEETKLNYKTQMWLEMQYMRLRCSIIHRVVTRKHPCEDDEIFESMFCKNREIKSEERQRLKQHKRFILKQTEKLENKIYNECGLLINESYPYICATPDGVTDDHIVEIKVPKSEEEFEKYLEGRETIAPKYMAQIQIQMYMANVTKALYCVLSPTFDTNGALHYVWVHADMEFVASLLGAAEDFWKDVVFPRLSKIYFQS